MYDEFILNSEEEEDLDVDSLNEGTTIQNSTQNLKSKMESLIRSIENLSEKKIRLEFEIKRQKRSLARKREELKRVNSSSQAKVKIALESGSQAESEEIKKERREIQKLLQESARILEE